MTSRACLIGCVALAAACGGKRHSRDSKPDARVLVASRPDAAPPVARTATRPMELGPGCRCAAVKPDAVLAHRAARLVFVGRMDRIHRGLRPFMAQLDRAVGDDTKRALADAAPHRKRLGDLVCQVDCLLAQFVGLTPSAWQWIETLAGFLDAAGRGLARLVVAPDGRPSGPGIAQLTTGFNAVARASNRSIGIPLLAPSPPRVPLAVDSLSFRAKSRRLVRRWVTLGADFRARWLGSATPGRAHPLAAGPLRFRVQAARLRRQLQGVLAEADALLCGKGATCATLAPQWKVQRKALRGLIQALSAASNGLRGRATVDQRPARSQRLLAPLGQAFKTWHGHLVKLR